MKSLRPERIRSLQSLSCFFLFGFLVAGFTSFAAQPNLPGDWPTFGNGPAHTGYFPAKLNGLPFVFKWNRQMPADGISQPAVAGGRVFVSVGLPSRGLSFRALDANTGQRLWTNVFSAATTISPPT